MSEDATQTILEKTARLKSLKEKVERFMDSGGDLKSPEAVPLGVGFIHAYLDLAKEFGGEVPKEETTESKNTDAILKMFTFDKKRELEQYCRTIVIDSSAFANFIFACELTGSPFIHEIHYRDHVPEHLHLSDKDFDGIGSQRSRAAATGRTKSREEDKSNVQRSALPRRTHLLYSRLIQVALLSI